MQLEVEKFLEDTTGRYAIPFAQAIQDQLVAEVQDDRVASRAARLRIEELLRATMGMGEILGAEIMLRQAAAVMAPTAMASDRARLIAFADQPVVPQVTFEEAVEAMVARMPVTIRDAAERTAARIAELYGESSNVAFARATTDTVTRTAKDYLVRALREGISEATAAEAMAKAVNSVRENTEAWSTAYARTVFRTNINTAVTAGRFRQAQDPDIRAVIPAFRFDAVGDGDTRHNHEAADGIILRVDNPEWRRIAPPLGYNCRCQVSLVTRAQLRRAGKLDQNGNVIESRIPPDAKPDDGFRHTGRPDIFISAQA